MWLTEVSGVEVNRRGTSTNESRVKKPSHEDRNFIPTLSLATPKRMTALKTGCQIDEAKGGGVNKVSMK